MVPAGLHPCAKAGALALQSPFRVSPAPARCPPRGRCNRRATPRAARPAAETLPEAPSRPEHNAAQADFFAAQVDARQASVTPEVDRQLAEVAAAVPGLGPASRVLDVGAGAGALIPHLQARGVSDVLAVDVCPAMLAALEARFEPPAALGNAPGVRAWLGDVCDLPAYQGPFDAAFFNAVFANLHDPRDALLRTALLLRPGSHVVISHPLGRRWLERFAADQRHTAIVPHALPALAALRQMVADLPLEVVQLRDEEHLYLALLRVPDGYAAPGGPLRLAGEVVRGFGRGSRQLGVPTANLAPGLLQAQLQELPNGVYFGWARLDPCSSAPAADAAPHKMVMNVGRRPTFDGEGRGVAEVSVELHILHAFGAEEFYGRPLRAVALGFVRPEARFGGVQELLARIHADIGLARAQLDSERWAAFKDDPFLQ